MSAPRPATVFDLVGGQPFFDDLAARFYAGVAQDQVLRPLYPEDLAEPTRHMAGFLAQYWGGPPAYSDERGHPRLRMRHMPFRIGPSERDAWLRHMLGALRTSGLAPDVEAAMVEHVSRAADFLVNTD